MLRFPVRLLTILAIMLAQQQSNPVKPQEDMSRMLPEAHAPLFQKPKSVEAGAITERVTGRSSDRNRCTPPGA
jgi:hypothetical protein